MRYMEFIGVFLSPEVDAGMPQDDLYLPATIDLDAVQAYNDDGKGRTSVSLKNGDTFLLKIPYARFKRMLYFTPNPQKN